jgi:hypothetical protein
LNFALPLSLSRPKLNYASAFNELFCETYILSENVTRKGAASPGEASSSIGLGVAREELETEALSSTLMAAIVERYYFVVGFCWREGGLHPRVCKILMVDYATHFDQKNWREHI